MCVCPWCVVPGRFDSLVNAVRTSWDLHSRQSNFENVDGFEYDGYRLPNALTADQSGEQAPAGRSGGLVASMSHQEVVPKMCVLCIQVLARESTPVPTSTAHTYIHTYIPVVLFI